MELAGAISSALALLQGAEIAIKARDDAKAQHAIAEAQGKLVELSTAALSIAEKNMSLLAEMRELQEKLSSLSLKTDERDEYEITDVCFGIQAYQPRQPEDGSKREHHYLCQPCFDKGVKAMLRYQLIQSETLPITTNSHWICPENSGHSFKQN